MQGRLMYPPWLYGIIAVTNVVRNLNGQEKAQSRQGCSGSHEARDSYCQAHHLLIFAVFAIKGVDELQWEVETAV